MFNFQLSTHVLELYYNSNNINVSIIGTSAIYHLFTSVASLTKISPVFYRPHPSITEKGTAKNISHMRYKFSKIIPA